MKRAEPGMPQNHLSGNHYTMPADARSSMTSKQLRETLLATDGWVMASGRAWDIKSKSLGAGVYSVYLVERNASPTQKPNDGGRE